MRIERLRFSNLSALRGSWEVDFTHPTLAQSGIFAIVGATGSGKSTILDAICLALYGRTPRLANVSRSENEILSRGLAFCAAELEFSCAGGRFLACWEQRRARGDCEGALQSPRHRLFDLASGALLEEGANARVKARIIEEVGLGFEQFTRTVLLAQGDFAAFLQASERDRAALLEQLTDSEVYGRLSVMAFLRNKEGLEEEASLQGVLQVLPYWRAEKAVALVLQRVFLQRRLAILKENLLFYERALREQQYLEEALQRKEALLKARLAWQVRSRAFLQDKKCLEAHERACVVEKVRASVLFLNGELARFSSERKRLEAMLCALRGDKDERVQALSALKVRYESWLLAKEERLLEVKKAQDLDYHLRYLHALCSRVSKERDALLSEIATLQDSLAALSEREAVLREEGAGFLDFSTDIKGQGVLQLQSVLAQGEEIKGEDLLRGLRFVLALREGLIEGVPCLLCGSTSHQQEKPLIDAVMIAEKERLLRALLDLSQLRTSSLERLRGLKERLLEREEEFAKLEKDVAQSSAQRDLCLSGEAVDVFLMRQDEEEKAFKNEFKALEEGLVLLKQQEAQSEVLLDKLEEEHVECVAKFARAEDDFKKALLAQGFVDEADFLSALLPLARAQEIRDEAQALSREETLYFLRLHDVEEEIVQIAMRHLSFSSVAQLEGRLLKWREDYAVLQQELGALMAQITRMHEEINAWHQAQMRFLNRRRENRKWRFLNELIGSADGKKFRSVAQSMAFAELLLLANRQLHKMSDRYSLLLDTSRSLSIMVRDNWQAGALRMDKNLSGGERFLVSLALSLALSELASNKVKIQSLFIDEGFGSLDEESLHQAFQALSGLQYGGRLVGLISHVEALKSRVGAKIEVRALGGGVSALYGDFCRRLSKNV